jgi:acetyl esterase/lipase
MSQTSDGSNARSNGLIPLPVRKALALPALLAVACGHDAPKPMQRNIAYAESSSNTLDIYSPAATTGAPVIVWFHGGALLEGDKQDEVAIAERFADAGIVTVVANYRLSPAVAHPAHVEDAAAAVAWTTAHIAKYGGDPARVVVAGYSAGAYLAALLMTDERYLATHQLSPSTLRGVVLVAGFYWVERAGVAPDRPKTVWGSEPQAWIDASPAHHLRAKLPPTSILYADGDEEWRRQQNEEFAVALKKIGTTVEIERVADRDHGTIHSRMGTAGDPALDRIIKFVRPTVK